MAVSKGKGKGKGKEKGKARKVVEVAAAGAVLAVTTLVNGQIVGKVEPGDLTVRDAAVKLAADNGIKAFSIKVNGVKDAVGTGKLAGAKTLEVFAKDTRGLVGLVA